MSRITMSVVLCTLLVAACSGGGASSTTSATRPTAPLEVAGPKPSASATMVCAKEAQDEIAAAIGTDVTAVSKPVWDVSRHLLSCDYRYPAAATFALSVKEMSSPAETTSYYDAEVSRLGRTQSFGIAQGAFRTTNGSLVVRKDYKVLLIDVSRLPGSFGKPPIERAAIALNIGTVIMLCWSGT